MDAKYQVRNARQRVARCQDVKGKQREGIHECYMAEGARGVKGGEKRDSTLVQSQPQAAQHATRQCQTVEVKQSGVCPNKACERNTIKYRTARLPFLKEAKQEHSDVNNKI